MVLDEIMTEMNCEKKYIIFGAGRYGEEALFYYGLKNVAYFCDNKKFGSVIRGIEVIDFQKLQQIWEDYQIVLAVSRVEYKKEMQNQLEQQGISYEIFYSIEEKLQENNFAGEYQFINRSKTKEKLLIVLAGYKEYLWDDVFGRLKATIPEDMDVCILTAGYENSVLVDMCEKQGWSYLYTYENKLSLTQNLAIQMHPAARLIYKMDEDIFTTPGLFEELLDTYHYVEKENKYAIGFVAPIMAVNSYGYRRILERFCWLEEYEKKFGNALLGRGAIFHNSDVAVFFWNKTLPINFFAKKVEQGKQKFSICYHRYSIGCILMSRDVWEKIGGFKVAPEGVLGVDEENLCEWCMNNSYAIIIAEKAYAGHFSYGPQTERMKEFYRVRKDEFGK